MKLRKLALTSLLITSSFSFAGDWSQLTKLGQINAGYSSDIIIFSADDMHNPAGCATNHYEVNPSDANVEFALSLLLTAQSRSASVQIAVHPTKCGVSNYPLVTRIKLHP
ncbi:hypothetical protein [Reinekea sp. G2M2-21]|uniref:hypothetical protein n=1 Tax=Reinekea sp. G2M2-21 TaxID=2788942 RepID=UPI0018A9D29C|nr:hypothetical protein [Reinekea sp. G2M2-21]